MKRAAGARAHPNIALVKYWGKRDQALNLPAVGSISATLDGLATETTVVFEDSLVADTFELNGLIQTTGADRVSAFLDRVRKTAGLKTRARVSTRNDFPTAAGLASSASGFAALALAASRAAGLALGLDELGVLARLGSGSAPRSLLGGFVEMPLGERADGFDCVPRQLAEADHWPLDVWVAVVSEEAKAVGSTLSMVRSRESSPFYAAWVETAAVDLECARQAIWSRDFEALASVAEHNCLKMHGVAMTSRPAALYWMPGTVEVIHAVREARQAGVPCFFTVDAGPQVKIFAERSAASRVSALLESCPGVGRVIRAGIGSAAEVWAS